MNGCSVQVVGRTAYPAFLIKDKFYILVRFSLFGRARCPSYGTWFLWI